MEAEITIETSRSSSKTRAIRLRIDEAQKRAPGKSKSWPVLPLEERVRRPETGLSKTDEGAGAREREVEAFSSGAVSGEADPEGRGLGKF